MFKIGHRGAAGHVLENSISSIQYAFNHDVDGIEIDVQLTKCWYSMLCMGS